MVAYEGMFAETVMFYGDSGDQISGYLARPLGAGQYPCVIVLHEVFGLVPHIKEIARKLAGNGYIAIAPDLHHREGPGDPEDVAAVVREAGGNPDSRTVGDVEGAVSLLKSLPYSNDKVGIIGFCSGGRQTFLSACTIPSINAAVSCYGGRIVAGPEDLNERQPRAPIDLTSDLSCPLLGLFGAEDSSPSPNHVQIIEQELKLHDKVYETYVYDNAGHAFFADYRPSYRQHASVDGWERIFGWFNKHLN